MSPVWKFQLRQSNVFLAEELPILYRDEHIVVIDKPPALLVHRSEIDRHETRFAIQILRDQIGQYVWPAHRLDRGTSGVLLFGLSKEIASQIRRHLKHIAHPVIGDATHGKGIHNRYFAEHLGCHRMLLACVSMAFNHPVEGQHLEIKAPASGEFADTLVLLGWPLEPT